ncbi:MAG: hypothetical protein HQL15_10540 [Candidatus Omnitrophica bacterium]|nr:hypothetical protein [Candidatus Omnitrophota bacterium]
MNLEDQIDLHLAADKDKIISRITGIEKSIRLCQLTLGQDGQSNRLADDILWLCELAKGRLEK